MGGLFTFLKTTAIGGLVFLFPVAIIGIVLAQTIQAVTAVSQPIFQWLGVSTVLGHAIAVIAAVVLLLLLCFLAGLLARRSFSQKLLQSAEEKFSLLFPRYTIFKAQLAGSIGGREAKIHLVPVLARFQDWARIAFEVERSQDGLVTIFLPGAPDPWNGSVLYLRDDQVEPLSLPFQDALALCEQLGRGSDKVLSLKSTTPS